MKTKMTATWMRWLVGVGLGMIALGAVARAEAVKIAAPASPAPRVSYGVERVAAALKAVGAEPQIVTEAAGAKVVVRRATADEAAGLKAEGFVLRTTSPGGVTHVAGVDDSGVLYGCIELAARIAAEGKLPASLDVREAPAMKLRGPAIGMQKTYILSGRHVYEYPYTPEEFPFFYDRAHWTEYLDFLVKNRMNTLYLWNGHPFASLVKLADYPYAQEVSDETFAKNVEMFRWLAQEADKRGIWVVQMFYNIILSKPFAEHHGLKTQLNAWNDVAADYTRKSIAEFVRQYPNVGLLVCLGEALQDIPTQSRWCTEVILPGVKDGMKAAGLTAEPPVVIRAHATDPKVIMPAALQVYKNLYTMAKFNGESLTTWEPRGVWQETHQMLSGLGTTHVVNVHILANLEPFRYGAVDFIKKSVIASRDRLGGGGLHLYPLAYWNWPDSPDATAVPLKQIERDWIWFEAWARYAWNPDIAADIDHAYWIDRLAEKFGTRAAAEKILEAYNASGECAPRLLRRFGITEGNRQTLSLGMTLDQLVAPEKYRPYPELWKSQAPEGERLQEFVEREAKGEPHVGETPVSIAAEVLAFSAQAVAAIEAAAPHVTREREEFARLRNDMACIRAMSVDYVAKSRAALEVLRFRRTHDVAQLRRAREFLTESLGAYRELIALTADTYRFANSMQTSMRRVPVSGVTEGKPANFHWRELLPVYERELADLDAQLAAALSGSAKLNEGPAFTARSLAFRLGATIGGSAAETYTVQTGSRLFTDRPGEIQSLAPAFNGFTGIRFPYQVAAAGRLPALDLTLDAPGLLLVGYIRGRSPEWLRPPELETNATAGDQSSTEPVAAGALVADGLPPVDVYTIRLPAGRSEWKPPAPGAFVILGVAAETPALMK